MGESELCLLPRVALIGHPCAGKGEANNVLDHQFGFFQVTASDGIRGYAKDEKIVLAGREDYHRTRDLMVAKKGPTAVSDRAFEYAFSEMARKSREEGRIYRGIAIDGIRQLADIERIMEFPQALLIGVHASPELCHQRAIRRGRPGDDITWEQFMATRRAEGPEVEELLDIVRANHGKHPERYQMITNEGTEDQLADKLRGIMLVSFNLVPESVAV